LCSLAATRRAPLIVVDASAVLELLLRTERGERVADRVFAPEQRLHAPHLIDVEVTQALRRLVQLKEIDAARAELALGDFLALVFERHSHLETLPRLWQLRDALTAYEASYVALAEGLQAPLLTCDGKLARAHAHDAVVALV
jgi:predicted nucleic acid-binding protein